MRIEETTTETIVHCGSQVEISCVIDQKSILLQALQLKKPILLEASEISKIDTAGVQLFLSFIRAALKLNLTWHWQNPSLSLIQLSNLLGLEKSLVLAPTEGVQ